MTGAEQDRAVGRGLWTLAEPVHAVTYFAPEARAAFADAGLTGFWRGYFAGRAAPLGAVGPAPVVALFAGFAPATVARALPDVWTRATPAAALDARRAGAAAALRRLVDDADALAAADALEPLVAALPVAGRALGAANAAVDPGGSPAERLWQACTTLRELRGDGHVAAQLLAGLAGVDALVLRAGADLSRELLQPARGWTDADWVAAADRLRERELLDDAGRVTDDGADLLAELEWHTDAAAEPPWPADDVVRVAAYLAPVSRACRSVLPDPDPIGVPAAWDPVRDPDGPPA